MTDPAPTPHWTRAQPRARVMGGATIGLAATALAAWSFSARAPAEESPRHSYSPASVQAAPSSPITPRLNLNLATAAQLELLPGIGAARAAAIIAERDQRAGGRFTTIDDLDSVRGIGPKTMERLRPLITVE